MVFVEIEGEMKMMMEVLVLEALVVLEMEMIMEVRAFINQQRPFSGIQHST